MKVLVTGASGFIGGYVCEVLQERGHEVWRFDRQTRTDPPPHDMLFLGDTRDAVFVDEAVAQVDGVIHLAGVLGTQETIHNPLPSVETNILGGLNVFEAVRAHGKPAVYIAVGNHWMNNSYSITKTTAERFALMYNQEHHTEIAVVRALNAYGPRQKEAPVRKIVPSFIRRAMRGEPIQVYGDGQQVMDMVYVADVASILVDALVKDHDCYDRPMEAGTGRRTTVLDVARLVDDHFGTGIEFLPMRPGEPPAAVVLGDPTTLEPLNWFRGDLVTLEDGMRRTIDWYRAHP